MNKFFIVLENLIANPPDYLVSAAVGAAMVIAISLFVAFYFSHVNELTDISD